MHIRQLKRHAHKQIDAIIRGHIDGASVFELDGLLGVDCDDVYDHPDYERFLEIIQAMADSHARRARLQQREVKR